MAPTKLATKFTTKVHGKLPPASHAHWAHESPMLPHSALCTLHSALRQGVASESPLRGSWKAPLAWRPCSQPMNRTSNIQHPTRNAERQRARASSLRCSVFDVGRSVFVWVRFMGSHHLLRHAHGAHDPPMLRRSALCTLHSALRKGVASGSATAWFMARAGSNSCVAGFIA